MPLRVVNQLGSRAAAAVLHDFPDAEIVDFHPDGPPPGFTADVMFGGWGAWGALAPWVRTVPWVQLSGTGIDGLPAELFDGRTITCARGASGVAISEFVLAAMLAFAKDMPNVWLDAPPKHWNFHPLSTLEHKTLALVGLGGIGCEIATRALPFGMRVRAVRRTAAPSPVAGVEIAADFTELLHDADHLVLAAPGTARTRHLVDEAALAAVKPGVHLVNIARGSLIDQDALRVALDDGRVAMATLDTVDPEPLPAGHWMYAHPKVRLSAHVSWGTTEHFTGAIAVLVENLHRHVEGRPLRDLVDLTEGY
jgi:phosphoglycerate dehydrogenase-like enzyme